jgi:hypothetical protein
MPSTNLWHWIILSLLAWTGWFIKPVEAWFGWPILVWIHKPDLAWARRLVWLTWTGLHVFAWLHVIVHSGLVSMVYPRWEVCLPLADLVLAGLRGLDYLSWSMLAGLTAGSWQAINCPTLAGLTLTNPGWLASPLDWIRPAMSRLVS